MATIRPAVEADRLRFWDVPRRLKPFTLLPFITVRIFGKNHTNMMTKDCQR